MIRKWKKAILFLIDVWNLIPLSIFCGCIMIIFLFSIFKFWCLEALGVLIDSHQAFYERLFYEGFFRDLLFYCSVLLYQYMWLEFAQSTLNRKMEIILLKLSTEISLWVLSSYGNQDIIQLTKKVHALWFVLSSGAGSGIMHISTACSISDTLV